MTKKRAAEIRFSFHRNSGAGFDVLGEKFRQDDLFGEEFRANYDFGVVCSMAARKRRAKGEQKDQREKVNSRR